MFYLKSAGIRWNFIGYIVLSANNTSSYLAFQKKREKWWFRINASERGSIDKEKKKTIKPYNKNIFANELFVASGFNIIRKDFLCAGIPRTHDNFEIIKIKKYQVQASAIQDSSDVCRLKVDNSDAVVCDEKPRVNVVAAE